MQSFVLGGARRGLVSAGGAPGLVAALAASVSRPAGLFSSGLGGVNRGVFCARSSGVGNSLAGRRAVQTNIDSEGKMSNHNQPKAIVDSNRSLLQYLKQEIQEEKANHEKNHVQEIPPPGWKTIPTGELLHDEEHLVLMLEKHFGNEHIVVVTSTQVMDGGQNDDQDGMMEEDGMHDDVEEDGEDSDDHDVDAGLSGLMLVAISKQGKSQPLYVECMFGPGAIQILRAHVGAGPSSAANNETVAVQILFSTYMQYVNSKKPDEGFIDTSNTSSSPSFNLLSDTLQEKLCNVLEERGIGAELSDYVINTLYINEDKQYLKFITTLEQWASS